MLVMVDQPTGENYYGSQVAAPICVEVLSEVLPYMGYFPEYSDEELAEISVTVPSVQYYAVDEAKQTMTDLGLKVEVRGNGDSVLKQVPASVEIERGGTVVLYTDTSSAVERTTVPNIAGLTKQQAKELLIANGLNLSAQGMNANDEEAHALFDQSYPEGASVPVGTAVSVTFASTEVHSQ